MNNNYELLVIGGGSAGITSAIYAKRAGRKVAIIEKMAVGGQLNMIDKIENYTGFSSVDGGTLAANMKAQAKALEIPIIYDEAIDYSLDGDDKIVYCKRETYLVKAVIFATGSYTRELEIEGEQTFKGRGVSYCATCDGNFFKGKKVAVVGSLNYALNDAIYLSNLCEKVYLVVSDNEFNMDINPKIEVIQDATAKKIEGENAVQKCIIMQNGKEKSLSVDGIFVAVGKRPDTVKLYDKIELNEQGYIICNEKMETSVLGVYACGDVRKSNLKQVATAVGDGAIAGTEASKYILRKLFSPRADA